MVTLHHSGFTLGTSPGAVVQPYEGGGLELLRAIDAQTLPAELYDLLRLLPGAQVGVAWTLWL